MNIKLFLCTFFCVFVAVQAQGGIIPNLPTVLPPNATSTAPTPAPGTTLIEGNFIAGVTLQANMAYTVWTSIGFHAIITTNKSVNVAFRLPVHTRTVLPAGFSQGQIATGIDANIGLKIDATPSDGITSITLLTPTIAAGVVFNESSSLRVMAIGSDFNTQQETMIAIEATIDSTSRTISIPYPTTYPVILILRAEAKVKADFGIARAIVAGANQTIEWGTDTVITYRSRFANTITVVRSNVTAKGNAAARTAAGIALGVYIEVTLASQVAHDSIIRLTYTAEDLIRAGIKKAENLRLAFYNEATSKWEFPSSGGSVDINARVIIQSTNHFSTWGAFETSSGGNNSGFIMTPTTLIVLGLISLVALLQ